MNEKYEKIINLPYKKSTKHTPMSKGDRAAQFAPYSALSGYEDAVEETARPTDGRIELDEYEKDRINAALVSLLSAPLGTRASITYFHPDERKNGGAYVTITDEIAKYDEVTGKLDLIGGRSINLDCMIDICIKEHP